MAKGSKVEIVFLPRFGDVGLEWPRDIGSDERAASAESSVCVKLFLNSGKVGVFPQASCDLSAVFNRKQAKVAVALLKHEVVCLPYLLRGGMKRGPAVCEARFGACRVGIIFLAFFFGLGILDGGSDESVPGGVVGRPDE